MHIPNRSDPTLSEDADANVSDLSAYKPESGSQDAVAPPRFSLSDMSALYQRVRASCPTEKGLVIAVIGPHPKTGVTSVVHGIGRVAAELGGQRVLLCDGTGTDDLLRLNKVVMRRSSIERLAAFEGVSIPAGLVSCPLDNDRTPHEMIARVARYAEALRKFRSVFDLIVVDVPASNVSDLGPALAKHVDAVVVVVEAEKTRAPLIKSLVSVIQGNGGKVAGLVLNKRIQHIPKRVYRWL
jgi:Mrp family chromosome partitioning ATPase